MEIVFHVHTKQIEDKCLYDGMVLYAAFVDEKWKKR